MLPKEPAARAPATATASAGMELRSLAARVASGELPRAEYIGVCVWCSCIPTCLLAIVATPHARSCSLHLPREWYMHLL